MVLSCITPSHTLDHTLLSTLRTSPHRRAKFVFVDGDQDASGGKPDPSALASALELAESAGASQFILVTLSGSGASGSASAAVGGFSFFAKPAAASSAAGGKRSAAEQRVAESGLPFIAVRAAVGVDSPEEELGALTRGVALAGPGELGAKPLKTSRQQVRCG